MTFTYEKMAAVRRGGGGNTQPLSQQHVLVLIFILDSHVPTGRTGTEPENKKFKSFAASTGAGVVTHVRGLSTAGGGVRYD